MSRLTIGDFSADASDVKISVGGLEFSPAEIEKATELIGTARRMSGWKGLPEQIDNSHLFIRFHENGSCLLGKTGLDATVTFTFENADDLVTILQEALKCSVNDQVLQPTPRAAGYNPQVGDIIEGRG